MMVAEEREQGYHKARFWFTSPSMQRVKANLSGANDPVPPQPRVFPEERIPLFREVGHLSLPMERRGYRNEREDERDNVQDSKDGHRVPRDAARVGIVAPRPRASRPSNWRAWHADRPSRDDWHPQFQSQALARVPSDERPQYSSQSWHYHRPAQSYHSSQPSGHNNDMSQASARQHAAAPPRALPPSHWHRGTTYRPIAQDRSYHYPGATAHEVPVAVSNEDPPTPPCGSEAWQSKSPGTAVATKRSSSPISQPSIKRSKGFDKLDLLVSATLEMGPLQENAAGCSCPKSKCIALYCDCFKAGRRCDPNTCNCLDCKNTIDESGPNGARTKAIRSILARNPRAFVTAGMSNPIQKLPPGEVACNCLRSRCLKLYCTCFQSGKVCNKELCSCIKCLNTEDDPSGERQMAIQQCLEKRPDAFKVRVREPGLGCACKNNRCIRKYCECFRNKLPCSEKCTCVNCENQEEHASEEDSSHVEYEHAKEEATSQIETI